MKRAMPFLFYGLGGIAVAGGLAWASFTVAGQQLSTPGDPIQPVAVSSSRPSPLATVDATQPPTPHPEHTPVPTSAPTQSIGLRPSPRPHDDGRIHSGDD